MRALPEEQYAGLILRWKRTNRSVCRRAGVSRSQGGGAICMPCRYFNSRKKQTDVNLTADLISDAWRGRYEQAVICSNDADLVGALRAVSGAGARLAP
jgi:uncharacterized LabA/DUF88 family protein